MQLVMTLLDPGLLTRTSMKVQAWVESSPQDDERVIPKTAGAYRKGWDVRSIWQRRHYM